MEETENPQLIQKPLKLKSIIFWDMTPCSPLNDDTLHNRRCENLKSYNPKIASHLAVIYINTRLNSFL
jgi:hypothetical protein